MIVIEPDPLGHIKSQALSIFPDECCGFLFGRENVEGNRIVSVILEVNNAKTGDKRRRFEITAKDYMLAERFAEESGLQLLGVYHSHPEHPAIPSEQDRVAAQPWFSYVIVSVIKAQIDHIRSWRLNEAAEFEEEVFSSSTSSIKTHPLHGNSNYSNAT
jgi:proteasome lid subunit RPN8/RPN11